MKTNILFIRLAPFIMIKNPHPQNILVPFAAIQSGTLLKQKGFQVKVIDTWATRDSYQSLVHEMVSGDWTIVAIDTTTSTVDLACQMIQDVKKVKKLLAAAYGQHASTLPETLLGAFDVCVIGEVELTLLELADTVENAGVYTEIKGLAYLHPDGNVVKTDLRPLIEDLDSLPMLDYELIDMNRYKMLSCRIPLFKKIKWGFIQTSRGCPYRCIYCSPTLRLSYGNTYRANSPERVFQAMLHLIDHYGVNAISIMDDLFTFDRERVIAICKLLIENRVKAKWVTQTRADCLDEELIFYMKKAGCVTVCIGIESGSAEILKILQKSESKIQMEQNVKLLHRAGIATVLFYMVGNPGETYEQYLETLKLALRLNSLLIQVAYFTPYPGSMVYETCQTTLPYTNFSHYNNSNFNMSAIPEEQFRKLQKKFYLKYFIRPHYILKYLVQRLPYMLFNFDVEAALIKTALSFLIPPQRKEDSGVTSDR